MKNNNGFSLITLVITIIIIIILAMISFYSSDDVIDNSINAKNDANAVIDDQKIDEIIDYELAGLYDLLDIEIDLMRVELSSSTSITYNGKNYGEGYTLYLGQDDIQKVEDKTGRKDLKPYHELSRSYIVNSLAGEKVRLEEDWSF